MSKPAANHPLFRSHVLAGIACGAAGIALFHFFGNATRGYIETSSLFYWWGFQWMNPGSETEHGWLILGLSAWLLWRRGRSNVAFEDPPSAIRHSQFPTAALVAMLAGLALHVLGFAAQQTRVSILAFLIFTWGVLRLAGGRRWGKAARFPLAFMIFALPISVLDEIGLPLRLWVTNAGEWFAGLAGIDVLRSGTQLVAPDGRFNYDVAAPCSGVRSLMALTALSVLIGYLNFQSGWRRALVLGLCFPLVYLGNVTRIVSIIFAAQVGGPGWGDRAHVLMGYGVFVIVLGGLFLAVAALHRWWPEPRRNLAKDDARRSSEGLVQGAAGEEEGSRETRTTETENGRPEAGGCRSEAGDRISEGGETGVLTFRRLGSSASPSPAPLHSGLGLGVALVLGLMGAGMIFLHRLAEMPPRGQVGIVLAADGLNPVELPAFLGTEWIGQRTEVSAVEREILPPDTGFSRKNYAYVADRTRDVFLSIVLSGRDRTSIHRPELCLVGQGWSIDAAVQQTFRYPARGSIGGESFQATLLRIRREVPTLRGSRVVPQLVAYWFVGGSTIVPSHGERFMRDAWNRIAYARADRWAYVLVQTDARDGEAAAIARMQTILDATLPVFQKPRATETMVRLGRRSATTGPAPTSGTSSSKPG